MPTVELIYDQGCPNVAAARTELLRAFARAGVTARWREWDVSRADAPAHTRGYGSPTILVNGADVSGAEPAGTDVCCRVYLGAGDGARGVPRLEDMVAALRAGTEEGSKKLSGGWRLNMAVFPSLGLALMPKLACPACWPAYAGLLGSVGLGFLIKAEWLLPLTAAFLVIALGALAYGAKRRRGYGPFLLGLLAGAAILFGKFAFDSDPAMYAGIALLMAASLWNTRPRRAGVSADACPACTPSRAKT